MHTFLKALGGCRIIIAGHIAPDIVPVPDRCQITKDPAVTKDRAHQLEIRQVCAAFIRVIEDIDIAIFGRVVACQIDHIAHSKGHHPDKHRQPFLALDKRFAGYGIIQPVRRVMCLGNDRVEGAAEQCRIHFIGNLFQPAAQDGKLHRVDPGGACRARRSAHLLNLSSS